MSSRPKYCVPGIPELRISDFTAARRRARGRGPGWVCERRQEWGLEIHGYGHSTARHTRLPIGLVARRPCERWDCRFRQGTISARWARLSSDFLRNAADPVLGNVNRTTTMIRIWSIGALPIVCAVIAGCNAGNHRQCRSLTKTQVRDMLVAHVKNYSNDKTAEPHVRGYGWKFSSIALEDAGTAADDKIAESSFVRSDGRYELDLTLWGDCTIQKSLVDRRSPTGLP
jgi:hypothetical protein